MWNPATEINTVLCITKSNSKVSPKTIPSQAWQRKVIILLFCLFYLSFVQGSSVSSFHLSLCLLHSPSLCPGTITVIKTKEYLWVWTPPISLRSLWAAIISLSLSHTHTDAIHILTDSNMYKHTHTRKYIKLWLNYILTDSALEGKAMITHLYVCVCVWALVGVYLWLGRYKVAGFTCVCVCVCEEGGGVHTRQCSGL